MNQKLRHVTHIRDQSLRAQQHIKLSRSYGQVTKVPDVMARNQQVLAEWLSQLLADSIIAKVCNMYN